MIFIPTSVRLSRVLNQPASSESSYYREFCTLVHMCVVGLLSLVKWDQIFHDYKFLCYVVLRTPTKTWFSSYTIETNSTRWFSVWSEKNESRASPSGVIIFRGCSLASK